MIRYKVCQLANLEQINYSVSLGDMNQNVLQIIGDSGS